MATKAKLLADAQGKGLAVTDENTVKEIQAALDAATPTPDEEPQVSPDAHGNYRVRVTNEFSTISGASERPRAGLRISVGEGYEGPLTDEQLQEIEEDPYLNVSEG